MKEKRKRGIPSNSTPIINVIIEKLSSSKLTNYESNIIMAVIRKTYGWDKKMDWISGSQLHIATGIPRENCHRTSAKLVKKKVLIKKGKEIGINKKVEQWDVLDRLAVVSRQTVFNETLVSPETVKSVSPDTKTVSHQTHTKEKKETSTKIIQREKYGEFKNVPLSIEEYNKLLGKWGRSFVDDLIESMSSWLKSNGKTYKNYYAALSNWGKKEMKSGNNKKKQIIMTTKQ